ncbi:B- and T-lymphocyte attenuator-like isoform X3 [Simochromis diagramma]|uniref:B- and T-lymphocyte attenuator-like isoform X3 n=1 Tax=Simochromis diagramma TaxID=43689 RepID=UPI001A7E9D75|nr:B- and T-lymphocyte attenuator-like isoform X3 [Simochromis diagramma]
MSAMKHYLCRTILYLLIFPVLIITPDAQSDDSDCSIEIRVRRNTVHNASLGHQLWINCTVIFCSDSPPTVTWYKLEKTDVPVNVSSDSHIKTEWKPLNKSAGIFYLIFQNILRSDSGQYQCHGGGSMSHAITVNVHDNVKLTTASWTTLAPVNTTSADTFWPVIYRVVGSVVFVTVVILICVTSKQGCKGKPRKTTKPSQELYTHIYDNDV